MPFALTMMTPQVREVIYHLETFDVTTVSFCLSHMGNSAPHWHQIFQHGYTSDSFL